MSIKAGRGGRRFAARPAAVMVPYQGSRYAGNYRLKAKAESESCQLTCDRLRSSTAIAARYSGLPSLHSTGLSYVMRYFECAAGATERSGSSLAADDYGKAE
jgi:hypothetical protein